MPGQVERSKSRLGKGEPEVGVVRGEFTHTMTVSELGRHVVMDPGLVGDGVLEKLVSVFAVVSAICLKAEAASEVGIASLR